MTTCPSCKRDQVQSSAFCAYCGAVLDRPATASSPSPAPAETPPLGAPAGASGARSSRPQPQAVAHDVGDVGAYIVRRLLALAVDIALVGALIAVALRAWLTRATPDGTLTFGGFVQLSMLIVAAFFAYRWFFEGFVGSTLGKLVFGLAVGRSGGGSAGLGRAFVRNLVLPVDLAIIGFLIAAITPQRRRLGDLLAGTVVANARIGALAPLVGIVVLGASAYAVNAYSGGISAAQNLARDATRFGPALIHAASPTPIATLAPTPVPTVAPTSSPVPTPSTEPSASAAPSPPPSAPPSPV